MTHRRTLIVFLTLACLVPAWLSAEGPGGASAKEPAHQPGGPAAQAPGMGPNVEGLKQQLGLSEEQVQKLRGIMQAHHSARQALREQRRQLMEQLKSQVESKAADPVLQATLSQLTGLEKSLQAENDQFHQSLQVVLTPTQQAKMLLSMVNRHEHPRMGMPPRPDHPGAKSEHRSAPERPEASEE